jgi:hypothetical protein
VDAGRTKTKMPHHHYQSTSPSSTMLAVAFNLLFTSRSIKRCYKAFIRKRVSSHSRTIADLMWTIDSTLSEGITVLAQTLTLLEPCQSRNGELRAVNRIAFSATSRGVGDTGEPRKQCTRGNPLTVSISDVDRLSYN